MGGGYQKKITNEKNDLQKITLASCKSSSQSGPGEAYAMCSDTEAAGASGWEEHTVVLTFAALPQPSIVSLPSSFSFCWFKTSHCNKVQSCSPCFLNPKEGKWVIFSQVPFFFVPEKLLKLKTKQKDEQLNPPIKQKLQQL